MKTPHLSKTHWRQEIAALPHSDATKRIIAKIIPLILKGERVLPLPAEKYRALDKELYYLWLHDAGKKRGYLFSYSRRRLHFKKEVEIAEEKDLLPETGWPVEECKAYRRAVAEAADER